MGILAMNIQFSRKYLRLLPQHKKSELAASLLTFPRAWLLSLEKPVLPTIQKETRLVDLIGPRSWLILNVLEMEGTFLHNPLQSGRRTWSTRRSATMPGTLR